MTKQLEEVLGLPSLQDALAEIGEDTDGDTTIQMTDEEVERYSKALENSHELEADLRDPDGTEAHAKEMDEIFKQAMQVHKDAADLAFNIEAKHAGSILSPSATYLDLAMKASRSKLDSKLKSMKLKMDKQKLAMDQERHDHDLRKNIEEGVIDGDNPIPTEGKFVGDRNEMIKAMRKPKAP